VIAKVGEIERAAQNRVVKLFIEDLGYTYLGNWEEREDNSCLETEYLRTYLVTSGVAANLVDRALFEFDKAVSDRTMSYYDRNKKVYELLRYGVKVKPDHGEATETVWFIDWDNPTKNNFAIAEEVTVAPSSINGHSKRPDVVLYVNGIALGVLELKRSTVSVGEGIRQNIDNQKPEFIGHFFATMAWVMAGNESEGLRYGTTQTKEKYYLTWKEESSEYENSLHRSLAQMCSKERFLELIHDFIVFDAGTKKLCRHNQYFGVKAAQPYALENRGGIIWHTQGSGKSLTMVWLAKWIRENKYINDARVLIVTDRDELDKQIEKVFKGVSEQIYRASSGADLIEKINSPAPWLICSLIHKFGTRGNSEASAEEVAEFVADLKKNIPADFKAKGKFFVFIDEAHRTQSGDLHKAMKLILPEATFIGFTGTPLLRTSKARTIEVFGPYIHTYKYDEAVRDGVVLDLRYEAREVDQRVTSQAKIDQWFDSKTQALNDVAKAQLKKRWGTMQKVLSSKTRLGVIVSDIVLDMSTKDRLISGHGNAILVSSSIYEACKYYELFRDTELAGKVAIITSYSPYIGDIKGEAAGEGDTENIEKYDVYKKMLGDWFNEDPDVAVTKIEKFEEQAKKRFIDEPGQLKLLIVVDKLLTGFDAPSATYLYIDKEMRDHGLFQAICRVNRLDDTAKEYGYIVDYKDLFKSLEGAVKDYISGALDGYEPEDVAGLITNRLERGKQDLDDAREQVKALVEPVPPPKGTQQYLDYFVSPPDSDATKIADDERNRLTLYKLVSLYIRNYADLANEMLEAGYTVEEATTIKAEVIHFEAVRSEVKVGSGDAPDLKLYEPGMRHLIDTYIKSDESRKVSTFDDLTFVELFVKDPEEAICALPPGVKDNEGARALAIENNIRKVIIEENPINPKYFEKMSELLEELVAQRLRQAIAYEEYLKEIAKLANKVVKPNLVDYPKSLNTPGKRALFDNFFPSKEASTLAIDEILHESAQDGWRANRAKRRLLGNAVTQGLETLGIEFTDEEVEQLLDLVSEHHEY
jgi:type I restriction enzyme, R subunit